jgi:hypothetical protein
MSLKNDARTAVPAQPSTGRTLAGRAAGDIIVLPGERSLLGARRARRWSARSLDRNGIHRSRRQRHYVAQF